MVAKIIRKIVVVGALLLAACQTITPDAEPQENTALNRTEGVLKDADDVPQPSVESSEAGTSSDVVTKPEPTADEVVKQLQQQALVLQSEGRWQEAELKLERALRIDANKVDIYHQLATVRLGQERFAEAEQIALKGLSLTGQLPKYKASLWEVIAQCRSAMSDIKGANEARDEMLKWMGND